MRLHAKISVSSRERNKIMSIKKHKNNPIFLANSILFPTFAPLNEIVAVVAQG